MKTKMFYLMILLSFHVCKINACKIKEVLPNTININDSTTITINLYTPGCGQITEIVIYSYEFRDTISSVWINQINDTTITARFFIADTINIGPAAIGITYDNYYFYQSEQGILNIGTSLVQKPSICMVTVDGTNKNMIIWEKPNNTIIDSIFIYKETSMTDNYLKIGAISVDDSNYFVDTESIPEQNSNSYKISIIDSSGFISPLSDYHKTIHLTMNLGINGACNLIWDKYEGFTYSTYNVYKGSTIEGMLKIVELPSNLFTYTDLAPNIEGTYYSIEVTNPNGCSTDDLKSTGADYFSTRSNITYLKPTNSLEENRFDEKLSIYPNPANIKIFISTVGNSDILNLSIISLQGIVLINTWINNNSEIDISKLKNGLYILKIESNKNIITDKLLKN